MVAMAETQDESRNPEARIPIRQSRTLADDARAGEAIVEAAVIAAEERR